MKSGITLNRITLPIFKVLAANINKNITKLTIPYDLLQIDFTLLLQLPKLEELRFSDYVVLEVDELDMLIGTSIKTVYANISVTKYENYNLFSEKGVKLSDKELYYKGVTIKWDDCK